MMDKIGQIPDGIRNGLDKIPRSSNRVVNTVRTLVVLAVLAPGSCVGISAAGSWLYNTINGSSKSEPDDDSSKKSSAKDAVSSQEWETDPFIYENAWSCNEE